MRSCLIEPRPLLTLRVSRRRVPRANAVSLACSGDTISGSVAISTRGTPNLSSVYVTTSPAGVLLESSFLAESSSRHITAIPTSPEGVCIVPFVEARVVL